MYNGDKTVVNLLSTENWRKLLFLSESSDSFFIERYENCGKYQYRYEPADHIFTV
ncbi:hypothetical protein [Treponema sp. R6D11]